MSARKATDELYGLRVTRVDLVDKGDNPEAFVTLYKRKPELKKASPLTCPNCSTALQTSWGEKGQQIGKYCTECGAKISLSARDGDKQKRAQEGDAMADLDLSKLEPEVREHIEAQAAELKAANERATDFESKAKAADATAKTEKARADKAEAQVSELKKAAGAEDDDVMKGVPDEVRERLEKAESDIQKFKEDTENAEYTKRATVLDVTGTKPEKLGPILRRVAKGKSTEDDCKEIERLLKAMGSLAKKGGLTKELGSSGDPTSDGDTAEEIAIERAKQLVKDGKASTVALAMRKVWEQDPDLYKRHSAEKARR